MAGSTLLDTSAVVAFLRGDRSLVDRLGQLDHVYTSVIVIGELLYGALHSANPDRNLERVTDFAGSIVALSCDSETAKAYARLKQDLRAKGKPIPDNDLWIAATSVQHGLTLMHRDAHFDEIEEVQLETW